MQELSVFVYVCVCVLMALRVHVCMGFFRHLSSPCAHFLV